jgi:PAS domain S-box-containing protein
MGPRILIIDDEEDIRYTFKFLLSEEGYEVLIAENYESALEIISKVDIDLLFVDIILGDRTGIDILRKVKSKGMLGPVIMITGYPNIETASEAVRLGAFDYLSKPIRKEKLLQVTNRAIHFKTLIDEKSLIEAEKERYRRNLDAIFRSLKDAIVTVDHKMRVIETNEATKGICGFHPHEIIGKEFTELPVQCTKSCHKVLSETLEMRNTVKEYRVECRHQARPGQVVLVTSSPLTDQANKFIGALLVVRDITRLNDLERQLRERHQFHKMIGKNRQMQNIYRLIDELADTAATVVITGESGTGKELIAEALHYHGRRAFKPFVTVNCSALVETLLESELFGHVRGAFTGAVKDKQGRFEAADGGTIFLDEIGDISPRIGLKLLRVLEQKEFERVGDSAPVKLDVRVIAATNQDLKEKVRLGEFREDLYYRLKVVQIDLPPLRERREDIPLLVDYFCDSFNKTYKKNIKKVSDEVLANFMRYPWPGNVRELEHAIEHAFVLCHGQTIDLDHLSSEISNYHKSNSPHTEQNADDESGLILSALEKTGWNKARAARLLGLSRQTIYRKIVKYNLVMPSEKM